MVNISGQISQAMSQYGYRFGTVSITRLIEVQEAVAALVRQGLVNRQLSAGWHFYLRTNDGLPEAKTIIILAMPQPITRLRFEWQGNVYLADVSPNYFYRADESRAEEILNGVLGPSGYKVVKDSPAMKTLAVRSGLAEYGKNNISYIQGIGSFYRLAAFYTDCVVEEKTWRESRVMEACEECSLCRDSCPTGSIDADRFLIHAEKCLGSLNERDPDYPYWVRLQPGWHSAFIGCMSCQFACPVNKPYLDNIVMGPAFTEEEAGQILEAVSVENLSPDTLQKLDSPSAASYRRLPANLRALIEKQSKE